MSVCEVARHVGERCRFDEVLEAPVDEYHHEKSAGEAVEHAVVRSLHGKVKNDDSDHELHEADGDLAVCEHELVSDESMVVRPVRRHILVSCPAVLAVFVVHVDDSAARWRARHFTNGSTAAADVAQIGGKDTSLGRGRLLEHVIDLQSAAVGRQCTSQMRIYAVDFVVSIHKMFVSHILFSGLEVAAIDFFTAECPVRGILHI